MEVWVPVVFALFFGVALLIYVRQVWKEGQVKFGPTDQPVNNPTRENEPFLFHLAILVYAGGGIGLLVYVVMLLTGHVEPMPLN